MAVIRHIFINSHHPYKLAQFWAGVLERPISGGPNGCWIELTPGSQPERLFFRKIDQSRDSNARSALLLSISPVVESVSTEIARLIQIGAKVIEEYSTGPNLRCVLLADPEGNEFQVEANETEISEVVAEFLSESS
ncbi:lactoylglutathione lyase [Streptosporangium violaceochromogenes]|nr:lactoylglutathione lyase [Streptosporangium violaceochromogenes]